jgi:hypothetical protein
MGSQIEDKAAGEEVLREQPRLDDCLRHQADQRAETEARVVPESEEVRLSQTISRAAAISEKSDAFPDGVWETGFE